VNLRVEVKPVVKFEYTNSHMSNEQFTDHEKGGRERVKSHLTDLADEVSEAITVFLQGKYPAWQGNVYVEDVQVEYPVEFTAEVAD
jgi:hypothetical protein